MNFKRYLGNFNHFITRAFVLVISLFAMLSFAASNENIYQLTKVAQLEHQLIPQPNWQELIANPNNKQQYFVIRESGQIYLIDGDRINPKAILDMSVLRQKDSSTFKLTAMELHPNFALRDQVGYGTFYTAHIENINKNNKVIRLQGKIDKLELNFDAVITEWKFNAVNHQMADVSSKREVLRIGVPDNSMIIKQISFNPYIKSWNDDFGLLYVALSGDKTKLEPLYSGAILRINPEKFGLRNFRVPDNNPYMKNSQIHDAIYLLGGQHVQQFIWPGKNSEQILVSHKYDNKYLLSLTDDRNDWRDSAVKHVLYQSDAAVHDLLIYQGRELPLLRSKLLLLRQKNQHWVVDSLVFDLSESQKIRDEIKPQLEWSITSKELPTNSQIILSSSHYNEVFLLEKTISVLFRLTQQAWVNENVVVGSSESTTIEKSAFDYNLLMLLLLILVILGAIYYWFKRKDHSVKGIVRKQFASLELSESCQQIGLYHRHQRNAETIIDIVSIVSSEIKLNEQSLNVVNIELDHGFDNDKEESLRAIFANEKIDKMVDGKVRQISLLLADNRNNSYTVCLYMRKGSNRITKKPYARVINELIDWCWLVSEKINAENTEKRKVKSIELSKEKTDIKSNNKNKVSLHKQTAEIKSTSHQTDSASQSLVIGELSPTLKVVTENEHSEQSDEENSEAHSQVHQSKVINTELVNALEKLVNLKQQGFLTMDEFSKAKEKLLKDLFEK